MEINAINDTNISEILDHPGKNKEFLQNFFAASIEEVVQLKNRLNVHSKRQLLEHIHFDESPDSGERAMVIAGEEFHLMPLEGIEE